MTAKFRIFPDVSKTIAYAQMMEKAGASILTCHGRTREMKGQATGLADWDQIKAVKQAVKIPVFANGNVLYRKDVDRLMAYTKVDGVMSAEGNLANPCLFVPDDNPLSHPPVWVVANHYLDIVERLKTPTATSAIRAHLFRLLRNSIEKHTDIRSKLALAPSTIPAFRSILDELQVLLEQDMRDDPMDESEGAFPPRANPETFLRRIPVWAAQPWVRPLKPETYRAIMSSRRSASPERENGGVLEDLATGGTGEERTLAQGGLDKCPC